jgi:large subunit ribosomal protein L25
VDIISLKTRTRTGTGKSYTRKARVLGWVPAIYYGHNQAPKSIEIDGGEFTTLVRKKKTRSLFNLGLADEGGEAIAIIKEIQRDIIDRKKFLHIDFQHVDMKEKITVDVLIELVGLPPIGVKDNGGVLQHPAKTIKIECLPANIPEKIAVDVSKLNIGDSIHIRDIKVENAVIKDSPDEVIAVVIYATAEEAAKPAVAAEGAAAEGAAPVAGAPAKEGDAKAGAKPAADAKAAPAGKAAPAAKAKDTKK